MPRTQTGATPAPAGVRPPPRARSAARHEDMQGERSGGSAHSALAASEVGERE